MERVPWNCRKYLKIFLLLNCLVQAHSVDLKCDYSGYIAKSYSCMVFGAKITGSEYLGIMGEHLKEKSDVDVKYVAFYGSRVKKIPSQLFSKFSSLDQLDLQISGVQEVEESSLKGAKNLRKLHLRGNNVKSLEADTFVEASLLEVIVLHDNVIGYVDENAFKNLSKLETLYLGDNNIVELHKDTFIDLVSLREIYLHFNKIEKLERGLFRNNLNLEEIELDNNRIQIIDDKLFLYLRFLKNVNLAFNTCIDDTFKYGFASLSVLHEEIKDCTEDNTVDSIFQSLTTKLEDSKLQIKKLSKQVFDLTLNLDQQDNDLPKNSTNCQKKLDHCRKDRAASQSREIECARKVLELTSENRKQHNSIIERQLMNDKIQRSVKESQNAYLICQKNRVNCETEKFRLEHERSQPN